MLSFGVHYPKCFYFFLPITPYESPVSCMKTTGWAGCADPGTSNNRQTKNKCMQLIQVSNFFRSTPFTSSNCWKCFLFLGFEYGGSWFFSGVGWFWTIHFHIFFKIEVVIEIRSLEVGLDISLSRLLCHLCLFSNGMPVLHKRCQSQYHWVLSATLVFKKTWSHNDMTLTWHPQRFHKQIRPADTKPLVEESKYVVHGPSAGERARFCRKHQSSCRICVLGLFQKENLWQSIQQLSSCHLHRFCLSDSVRHSKQEGLKTTRQEAENLTEKTDISNQTIMFLCYWSHFDIFWSTGYFKCRHLCTILVLNLQSFRRDFSTGNPANPTQPVICMVATSSGHVPDKWS